MITRRHVTIALALLPLLAACKREERRTGEEQPDAPSNVIRVGELQPGPTVLKPRFVNRADYNAYDESEGQRLFGWYNCAGCHANGGGGIGPPLMDAQWIYGGEPEQIYSTIMQGRPNGMPSFAGRIPDSQVWQIVSYVRALSGQVPQNVRSARSDHMMYQPGSQSLQRKEKPVRSFRPPASEMP